MMIKKMYEKPYARGLEMVGGEAVLSSALVAASAVRAPKGSNTITGDKDYSSAKGLGSKSSNDSFSSKDYSSEFDW
jgi:hypothetical protein